MMPWILFLAAWLMAAPAAAQTSDPPHPPPRKPLAVEAPLAAEEIGPVVPADTLLPLLRDAEAGWRVAVVIGGRAADPAVRRFADRVALTQADLARRLEWLAGAQEMALPVRPADVRAAEADALRAQAPGTLGPALADDVRGRYPRLIRTLEGWTAGLGFLVADSLLPTLREELEQAEHLTAPLVGGSGAPPEPPGQGGDVLPDGEGEDPP